MTDQELELLTDAITREVLARLADAEQPCGCHQVGGGRCPRAIGGLVDQGAERLGLHADGRLHGAGLAGLIDHTLLKPEATEEQIRKLCSEASQFHFATVCLNPTWVAFAASLLRGTGVGVCTVVGFPLGANAPDVKIYETRRALSDGASEIDMVLNIGALKSRDYERVEQDLLGVICACKEKGALSKVIIETALLDEEEKIKACTLVKAAGADFVKTSTGFSTGGATVEDVALMRRVVGSDMGVKAAGGVRDAATAAKLVAAGATRLGASAGVRIVQEARTAGSGNDVY